VTLSRERFHSAGAPGSGTTYCKSYDKAGTEGATGFLTGACEECGRFVIFLDNASCHKSGAPQKLHEDVGGEIRAYCFPPYTPELSPAGAQWKSFRKAAGNRLYKCAGEVKQSMRAMPGKEIPIVKACDYLAR